MTLILPRTALAKDFVSGQQENVGIRIPANKVALELLKEFESKGGYGVAAPSANRFGKVSPTCANDVKIELSKFLNSNDLILDDGPTLVGIESTIIDCSKSTPKILRPGSITVSMISKLLDIKIEGNDCKSKNGVKFPGSYKSHYSPKARVVLSDSPAPSDGFIALSNIPTPHGAIRLSAPENSAAFARDLYRALRQADRINLSKVCVIPPSGDELSIAITDRIQKASSK